MTYYRIARQDRQTATWVWRTTVLTSLQAVFQLLRSFRALPQDSIRVFIAASKEELNEMLRCENAHMLSGSVTATQFLRERLLHVPGQYATEDGTTEPAVLPAMVIAANSSLQEYNTITAFHVSGDINSLERMRLERESGPGGDHNTAYRFTLPASTPQLLAWIRLQIRVQAGELQP
jgi:hypothetical protein